MPFADTSRQAATWRTGSSPKGNSPLVKSCWVMFMLALRPKLLVLALLSTIISAPACATETESSSITRGSAANTFRHCRGGFRPLLPSSPTRTGRRWTTDKAAGHADLHLFGMPRGYCRRDRVLTAWHPATCIKWDTFIPDHCSTLTLPQDSLAQTDYRLRVLLQLRLL